MSNVLNGMALSTAESAVTELQRILYPHCQRCAVAGSIRRRVQVVGDIEFVVIPKFAPPATALPGMENPPVDWLDEFLKIVAADDHRDLKKPVKAKGAARAPAWGAKYKKLVFQHVNRWLPVDLWITSPERFGSTFALRTGDSDFSRLLVTQRSQGGAMPAGYRQANGRLERCVSDPDRPWVDYIPVETPDEDAFFKSLGLPTLNPTLRTEANLRTLLKSLETSL